VWSKIHYLIRQAGRDKILYEPNKRKVLMAIPIMTFLAYTVILLNIPIFRELIVFIYLSFIPGLVILRLFKLKETSFLETVLFSVGLSIAFVMFMSLLVNEVCLLLGFSQSLSTTPLMIAISVFTLTGFFIEYRRVSSKTPKLMTSFKVESKYVPLSLILILIPLLSVLGVLYLNVSVILLSCAIIAALCIMSVVSRRLIPESLFPFLVFSISIALICQVLLTSKYVVGWDANLEYYVFRLTQINGHWGFLNANLNSLVPQNYNSMLSITVLPAVYSALMHVQGEIVFKILYPLIFSLVPLTLYKICEKQFGKLVGLLSAFFFIFSSMAFYGEPLGINRQIVAELFLLLSILLLIKPGERAKRRWLLLIFYGALVVSHYALTFIFLAMITFIFIISRVKPRFDKTINNKTILFFCILPFSWYALGSGSPLISLSYVLRGIFYQLLTGMSDEFGLAASDTITIPNVFTVTNLINRLLPAITTLFLIIGVLLITFSQKAKVISYQFKEMLTIAAVILAASIVVPSIATSLNFTRFYGITLLFLSPCFVLGGQTFLTIIGKTWVKTRRPLKRLIAQKSKNMDWSILLIAILLSAYFLSQVGFLNRVTGNEIHSYNVDFDRMITSNDSRIKISLYSNYLPEQDVFGAAWLSNNKVETAMVLADSLSESHVLRSYGLVPDTLLLPLTNTTIPPCNSFIYLGSLNTVHGVITTIAGSFNTSDISFLLDQNNLVYSNGNSEIFYVVPN
jgi:uncharacterized membrane protein